MRVPLIAIRMFAGQSPDWIIAVSVEGVGATALQRNDSASPLRVQTLRHPPELRFQLLHFRSVQLEADQWLMNVGLTFIPIKI